MPEQNASVTFCKVSINDDEKWVHGIITYINLEKSIAEIFLSAKYFKNYLKEGSKILIKSMGDDNETLFSGSITRKVISIRKQAIAVQIDKVMNYNNKRYHERFQVSYSCLIKTKNDEEFSATLFDLSIGGGMIYSSSDIKINSAIDVTVYISPIIMLNFKGVVVRKQKDRTRGFSYGIQLSEIDDDNEALLSELIEYLVIQKNHIAHEWKIFNRLKYTLYTISLLFIFIIVFFVFAAEAL
jgi:c-di-GMP-binding flagellar brake protein YcgR